MDTGYFILMRTLPVRALTRMVALLVLVGLVAAEPTAAQVSPPASRGGQATPARPGHTAADVQFMQGMIGHHAQALEMAQLVPSRTTRQDLRDLAERIHVSQQDEIDWIKDWLRRKGEAIPDAEAHHHHGSGGPADLMPGMLTPQELEQLRNAKGAEFDRLFLTFMIKHHEGALTMVRQLFATPGAGQEAYVFEFATDVDADQRMEIDRMQAILRTLPGGDATRPPRD